jgi:hypothetical protein
MIRIPDDGYRVIRLGNSSAELTFMNMLMEIPSIKLIRY